MAEIICTLQGEVARSVECPECEMQVGNVTVRLNDQGKCPRCGNLVNFYIRSHRWLIHRIIWLDMKPDIDGLR